MQKMPFIFTVCVNSVSLGGLIDADFETLGTKCQECIGDQNVNKP